MGHLLRLYCPPLLLLLLFAWTQAAHGKHHRNTLLSANATSRFVKPETGKISIIADVIHKSGSGHNDDDTIPKTNDEDETTTVTDEEEETTTVTDEEEETTTVTDEEEETTTVTDEEEETTTVTDEEEETTTVTDEEEETTTVTDEEEETTTVTDEEEETTTVTDEEEETTTGTDEEEETTTVTDEEEETTPNVETTTSTETTTTVTTVGPLPSPDEPPQLNATVIPDDGGNACIFASMKIVLLVPFHNSKNEEETAKMAVPSYAQPGGQCGETRQELYYTWTWPQEGATRARRAADLENKVTFAWTPTGDDEFALSSMAMNIIKTRAVIPDLHEYEEGVSFSEKVEDLAIFAAPKGQAHACAAASEVALSNGAGIELSDVHLQAFNKDNEEPIAAAVSCPEPRHVSNAIYIAVGAVLGGFVLIGVIGYVVYRMRTRKTKSNNFAQLYEEVY